MYRFEQEAGVRIHQVEKTIQDLLGACEESPQVVVFLVFKDAGYAGLGEHADDLVVHVEELSA